MDVFDQSNELLLRLLGYYNKEGQVLNEETEQVEQARVLAERLDKTFSNIENENIDEEFEAALKEGVFIMRDKDFHLYAYWPKNKVARITGVSYNRDALTTLPLEYKYWFTPGEGLKIAPVGTANVNLVQNLNLFEHLRSIDCIGRSIQVSMAFLPENGTVNGELISVGKDFLVMKDQKGNDLLISNHFCIRINPTRISVPAPNRNVGSQDNDVIPPMGIIAKIDPVKEVGFVRSTGGITYGLRLKELLENLQLGAKVVFSTRTEQHAKSGKTMIQAICVHSSTTVQNTMALAISLMGDNRLKECREVLQHILNEYPDNEEAQELMNSTMPVSITLDEDTRMYQLACEKLARDEDKQEALNLFLKLLDKDKKIKDCIPRIATCYYVQYNQEKDEEVKSVIRQQLLDFIDGNHTKLGPASSLNLRLQYFYKLGLDEQYIGTIDSVLQDPKTDFKKRAKMLYYKALKLSESRGIQGVQPLVEESLYLNPFNNKAELLLSDPYEIPANGPTIPDGSSRIIPMLFHITPASPSPDDYLLMDKSGPGYPSALLMAASAYKKDATKQNMVLPIIAEYFALRSKTFAEKKETLPSALYLWGELCAILPGFGYYLQFHLAEILAAILDVPILVDSAIQTFSPWQNRMNWKSLLLAAKKIDCDQWEMIFYATRKNEAVFNAILKFCASQPQLLDSVNHALSTLEIPPLTEGQSDPFPFADIMDKVKNRRPDEVASAHFTETLQGNKLIQDRQNALVGLDIKNVPYTLLGESDYHLLEDYYAKCIPVLTQFVVETNAQERAEISKKLSVSFNEILAEIVDRPSLFSVETIGLSIQSIKNSMQKVQAISKSQASPQLSVRVISDFLKPGPDGVYPLQIRVDNAAGAMPAEAVTLELASKKMLPESVSTASVAQINGGSFVDVSFGPILNPDAQKEPNWGFAVKCTYVFNKKSYSQVFTPLQVHLFQKDQFVPIEKNPYTYGPQLNPDDPTFVGRKEEIQYILNKILHPQRSAPQLIVYGQKRCGKSTLLGAVQKAIEEQYPDKAFCVSFTLSIDSKGGAKKQKKVYSDVDFYRAILLAIQMHLIAAPDAEKPVITIPTQEEFEGSDSPTELFKQVIFEFKNSMRGTPGWENRRLIVIIDEFTVLYNSIKKGEASENLLQNWKAIQESEQTNFATIFIGHDITPTFFAEPYATNAAAVIERYPVSYLDLESAKELIERPILANGKTRFDAKAVDRILYYTAGNPWYLQIFMEEMVKYINENEVVIVTDIDVYNVEQRFITKQVESLSKTEDFSSLINSGLDDRFTVIKDAQFVSVLREIAMKSKAVEWCDISDLKNSVPKSSDIDLNFILKDLDDRKVIERKDNNKLIRIKVGLFKEWLIRN